MDAQVESRRSVSANRPPTCTGPRPARTSGESGPVPNSPAAIAQMALVLTKDMLRERPPDDGHRRNLLSTTFRHAGIAIFRDRHGTVWMTQDFSN